MSIEVTFPVDLEARPLPERLRWWAESCKRLRRPSLRMIALLEEAATEVELGQRTELTYRGRE